MKYGIIFLKDKAIIGVIILFHNIFLNYIMNFMYSALWVIQIFGYQTGKKKRKKKEKETWEW